MSQNINQYKVDLREIEFLLFEHLKANDVFGKGVFEPWDEETVKMSLAECVKFSQNVLGPLNASGDRQGCRVVDGRVLAPDGFGDAWKAVYAAGWRGIGISVEHGGQGSPKVVHVLCEEFQNGANTAFSMYPGLTVGAADVILEFGTDAQKHLYAPRMLDGRWGGTMCLTEAHAGSDVGSAKSGATRRSDGKYDIKGAKIYISGGDNQFTGNIIHLVLARVEGAPPGTKGLSLFIVPAQKIDGDGNVLGSNDVSVTGIEHKMGINGSATCSLNFGENDGCVGELVGTVENQGISQMFRLMNSARIAVGIQSVALASSAYLNALDYAKDRRQGAHITSWKDPTAPRVAIIEHPDVRRMLLDMKARVEGIRTLVVKLALHHDRSVLETDEDKKAYHLGQIDLLVPLVKAYGSDQAYRVCETAIQVFGGAGYLKDWPIEQYARDSKIFSIYEGTNHIQAMDLVGRKLGQNGGANTQAFLNEVSTFVSENSAHPILGAAVQSLGRAQEAVGATVMRLLGWFQSGQVPMVPLNANRFLEMMSETAVGWLLLEQAKISLDKLADLPAGHHDRAFYEGKRAAAVYFALNVLPDVPAKAEIISLGDDSAINIPDGGFATI
ncbi:MAG: acyl-CoA dehydrogenase [Deltaproteobacteria bacterium]|nr:acyl-CoA dehydrogenase [Deltaproteobacteria bacterium]